MNRSASSREVPNGGAIAGLVLEEDKLSRAPRQHLTATRAHDDRIFDVQCTETDLVVRRLDIQHHILLEHSLLPGRQQRRFVHIEPDRVSDVMPAIDRNPCTARRPYASVT